MKVRLKQAIRKIITDFLEYADSKFNLSKLSSSSPCAQNEGTWRKLWLTSTSFEPRLLVCVGSFTPRPLYLAQNLTLGTEWKAEWVQYAEEDVAPNREKNHDSLLFESLVQSLCRMCCLSTQTLCNLNFSAYLPVIYLTTASLA